MAFILDRRALVREFARSFGGAPARLTTAPGRVNLIGEHIDYNGLPVLPLAIDRRVELAFRARDDSRVVLRNLDPRFPPVEFALEHPIRPDPAGAWGNYPRAAAEALGGAGIPLRGIEAVIGSTLPVASGLSSSSALVVASALALLDAADHRMPVLQLMDLLARGERYVGMHGGGMDQAVILGAREGHAVRIGFRPTLSLWPVAMPADWQVVLASSLQEAAKAGAARGTYNARVAECRTALTQFAERHLSGPSPADYAELLTLVPPEDALRMAGETLRGTALKRFRHVVSEAVRVEEAVVALREVSSARFGAVLQASHASLRDDYDVSAPPLDELVRLAQAAGAAGARLTGAGMGGYILCLTDRAGAGRLMDMLWDRFYRARHVPPARRSQVLFATEVCAGAGVTAL